MWFIDPGGTARTIYDGNQKIVVRRDPVLGDKERWQIIVQGNQSIFPNVFKDRDSAMRKAELWLQLREMGA